MRSDESGGSFIRGLAHLVAFLAILIVPPIGLAMAVGWPLPDSLPNPDAIDRALRFGISDEAIVNTLAVIAWLAWAQLALALIVEVIAAFRGRTVVRVATFPGVQAAAARLVAGMTMLVSTASPAVAGASPPPAQTVSHAVVAEVTVPSASANSWSQAEVDAPAPAPESGPTVTVQRHDTYWGIAEHHLGDGLRWREVRDLNVGTTMTDGHVIAPGSDLLRPGWILQLPADASIDQPAPEQEETSVDLVSAPEPSTVTVERGDHLWAIATEQLAGQLGHEPSAAEVEPYWQQLIEVNRDRLAEPANPSLIYAGQVLTVPPAPVHVVEQPPQPDPGPARPEPDPPPAETLPPAPPSTGEPSTTVPSTTSTPSTTAPTTVPSTTSPAVAEEPSATTLEDAPAATDAATGDSNGGSSDSTPIVIALGGLASAALAVGAKRTIERRRRRFGHEHPGQTSRATPATERPIHQAIVANADEVSVEDLRTAMNGLAAGLAETGSTARPRVVQHSPDHLEVLLSEPESNAPDGWLVDAEGSLWVQDPGSAPPDVSAECAAPLLVTIGQPDDEAQLYLDLEADGLISLVGDPDSARGLARSILTEIALSPPTDTILIMVVGDLLPASLDEFDHLSVTADWTRCESSVRAWAESTTMAIHQNGWPSTFAARAASPDEDALVPTLVVASTPPPADLVEVLLAKHPAPVAVVVAGEVDGAPCVIDCQPDSLTITDLGLTCVPQDLDADTLEAMLRLLESTDEPADDAPEEPSEDDPAPLQAETDGETPEEGSPPPQVCEEHFVVAEEVLDLRDTPAVPTDQPQLFPMPVTSNGHQPAGEDGELDYEILVRLLGPIRIEGCKQLRPKPTAVVAYLALHRSVTIEVLEDACWADASSDALRKRLKDVVSECRGALSAANLPVSADGRYTVGPRVVTDTMLFDRQVARAANQPPEQQADSYRSALELVTGKVFSYPSRAGSSFAWIDTENLLSQWEHKIQGIAQQCVETYLALGDHDQAIKVANHVLQALSLNTSLTEALMRAHAATGDLAAVETVYRAHEDGLVRVLNTDPDDTTVDLHHQLVTAS